MKFNTESYNNNEKEPSTLQEKIKNFGELSVSSDIIGMSPEDVQSVKTAKSRLGIFLLGEGSSSLAENKLFLKLLSYSSEVVRNKSNIDSKQMFDKIDEIILSTLPTLTPGKDNHIQKIFANLIKIEPKKLDPNFSLEEAMEFYKTYKPRNKK